MPAHFCEAKVINMAVMPLGKTSWTWIIPCCSRQMLLSACGDGKHLSPVWNEQCRPGAGLAGGRAETGQHPCHHSFTRGTEVVMGQTQFWGGLKGCPCEVLLWPLAHSHSGIPLQRGGTPFNPHRALPSGGNETTQQAGSSLCPPEARRDEYLQPLPA